MKKMCSICNKPISGKYYGEVIDKVTGKVEFLHNVCVKKELEKE